MKKTAIILLTVINAILIILVFHKNEKKLPPKEHKHPWVEKMRAYEIVDTTGYDEIYFVVYGNTPFFYLNGERAGSKMWGPIIGKKECGKVFFIKRIHPEEYGYEEEKNFLALEYIPADGVTTDPRLTQKWIRELVRSMKMGYIFDLKKWIEDATGSDYYNDEYYGWEKLTNFRLKIVSEIEKTPGASLLEKALRYTKKVVPQKKLDEIKNPDAWGRGDIYKGEW